ncbi:sugar ABC transporter substrate-binding protein [Sinorhizobium sp. 7-81]|uniref:ABC transporter substrate-binding protein n=1 Tax=unclassified Sinorhizobium TaxID=2613772 RepID=UPI0024C26A20|nr:MULTISPECIES: sugar ABC transporter substrate-binding protein [unclassified Sinorhizobium]MDK1389660.1 sugar ABC transporter substrate-binding protein [Sinorhizobium sp. 7-81]MDK1493701.1 sugar ABC transporter substrate-binding protein [Sinorhizobium sp. 8-89]
MGSNRTNTQANGPSPILMDATTFQLSRRQVLGAALAATVAGYTTANAAEPVTEVAFPGYEWSNPQDILFWRPFKEEFENSNPDVKIRDIPVPYGDFWDKQFVELSASNAPDIVTMFDTEIKSYVEHGFLEPLNSYIEKAGVTLDSFQPGARAAVKDGNIYGLLFLVNPRALFYHGSLLRNEDLEAPRNLAEFHAALRKLRKRDMQQWGFATYSKPGDPNNLFSEIMPIITGFGGAFFEKGTPTATKPETIEALKFYKQIYDEDLIPRGMDINVYRQLFAEGKIAMYAGGPFMSGLVRKASAARMDELGATALPFPGNRTFALSVFLGIGKTAQHKDAAARVLLAATSRRWQGEVLRIQGSPPGLRDIDYSTFIAANPWFTAFRDAANDPHTVSFAPDGAEAIGPEVIKIVGTRFDQMLFGDSKPEEAANAMQEDLEALLAARGKN